MRLAVTATPSQARFAPILLRGDVVGAFEVAAEYGCDGVELHLRLPTDADRDTVLACIDDYGMGVPTLGTGMAAGEDGLTFSDPDPEIRRQAVERVNDHIDLAARLNSGVTIGSLSGRLGSDEQQRPLRRAAAQACLAECCEAATPLGVTLFLEPLNRYECDYMNTVAEALDVIAQIGAPNLKLLSDTFHMNIEEVDIAASLRQAGSTLGHVHLVDSNRHAPGQGHLDVRAVLQALRDIDYQGYLSFEVLPLPDPRQAIEDAVRTVRETLAQL